MTTLATKNFTALVQGWAAVAQSSVAKVRPTLILSFTKGAILLAIAEAQASVSLWLQGLILQLLTVTRLTTSQRGDVDTWLADFDVERLPANASSGLVTYSRVTPTNPATIPIGALIQSSDGSQKFVVTLDTTNAAYSASANNGAGGYVIPATVTSYQVPVQNTVPGAAGNVQAGGLTIMQTGISGVDAVTNVAAFTNGFDAESDDDAKARFVLFINQLAKGTEGAIRYAVQNTRQGLQCQIFEPNQGGFTQLTVYIDDGTGDIDDATFNMAMANVYAIKAAGVIPSVLKAAELAANVTMTIVTATGYDHPTLVAQAVAAIGLYINGLGLGATPSLGQLSYMKVAAVALGITGVTDVTNYQLNGETVDLVPAAGQTIKAGTITVG
jgi:uncharacterized phage protein gp47/JayE